MTGQADWNPGGGRSSRGFHERTPLPRPRAERQALSRPEGTLLHVAATGLGLRGTHFEKRRATRACHPGEGAPVSAQQPGLASGTGHVLLRTGVASTVHKLSDGAPRALATPGPAALGAGRTLPPGFPPRSGGACCVVPPSRLGSRRGISEGGGSESVPQGGGEEGAALGGGQGQRGAGWGF